MNYIRNISKLKNRYFVIRHGESEANVKGIIISDPSAGTKKYGLSENGKKQVENSIMRTDFLNEETIIYTSDFKRAVETAEIIEKKLGIEGMKKTFLLRERFFGEFDSLSNSNYEKIWEKDFENADHTEWNVESVNSVLDRTTECVRNIEEKYSAKNVILVSHGDALQILQTAFHHVEASDHRNLKHLETAELRELLLL
jgi:glucosyl-3-phosphoglycerate phosphatase